ncbi:hypothetical protein PR202_ga27183 [Eleusine coracana subsp. coracana]|uniref:PB1 domain-containing protein n=1 Tax=Eleusine coracana subsp. coracana TaxID=191504 RepID=A0AAV5DFG2_ELECO|nr:hypothetical protein PR202_ga27183 [Eleusine coracana subsp. coracana]
MTLGKDEVDLRTTDVSRDPLAKVVDTSYRAVLPEIVDVLRTVCERHELPLAQAWIPCICQAKSGTRHTDEKFKYCVSTVDEACYIRDPNVRGFHQSCSEHHLFRGEGVVGRAFGTNEPCFSPDITAYSKTCYTLRVVSLKELVNEGSIQTGALTPPEFYAKSMHENLDEICSGVDVPARTTSLETSEEVSSWIASLVDAQNKGVEEMDGDLPFGFSKQEDEGFSVTTGWHTSPVLGPEGSFFSGFKQHEEYEVKEATCSGRPSSLNLEKTVEKRRTKTEKTPSWGFDTLKEEIVRRFSIAQETYVDLKYLDDESEWVLLTCDADLLECIDVYKSSSAQTVKILVNPNVQPVLAPSFGQTVSVNTLPVLSSSGQMPHELRTARSNGQMYSKFCLLLLGGYVLELGRK